MLPVRLFGFGGREASPRPGHRSITPRLAAWACRRHNQPGVTERTLARAEPCADAPLVAHRLRLAPSDAVRPDCKLTASALFRPRPTADSPALRPLHSLPHSASVIAGAARTFAGCSRSFRRSQTAETGTDSGAPKNARRQRPRCSAYRPRPAIWPRGFARPGHSNTARGFAYRRGQEQ